MENLYSLRLHPLPIQLLLHFSCVFTCLLFCFSPILLSVQCFHLWIFAFRASVFPTLSHVTQANHKNAVRWREWGALEFHTERVNTARATSKHCSPPPPLTLHNPPLSSAVSHISLMSLLLFQLSLNSPFQELPPFPAAPTCAFPSSIIYSRLSLCISQKEWWNLPDPHMTILSGHRTIFPTERPLDEVIFISSEVSKHSFPYSNKSNKESDIFLRLEV